MRMHERTPVVNRARLEIQSVVAEVCSRQQLTAAEVVHIATYIAADWTKFLLREERHPDDPGKKADEA